MRSLLAVVTTDGSHISGRKGERRGGGWAAVVERGSDGWVLRGRVQATSSTQMELRAAVEGLRSLEDGHLAELRVDCTAILGVHDRWSRGVAVGSGADALLHHELAREFERLQVAVTLLEAGGKDVVHRRAHVIAQAEARAANRGETAELPLPKVERGRARRPYVTPILQHRRGCDPVRGCVVNCAFYRRDQKARRDARRAENEKRRTA